MSKKGQVTVFIIIAIFIVVSGVIFFAFKDSIITENVPSEFSSIESSFLNCIEENSETGILILKSQGGYIENPEFVPGSEYMPFSSELDFFGSSVPFWHYISGNNIEKEQVPTIEFMEEQLVNYLEEKITSCNFEDYEDQGYSLEVGEPKVELRIKDESVIVDVDANFFISRGEETYSIKKHSVEIDSKLGSLYQQAKEVYQSEESGLFLENYSIDVLRNYLPVDGVEISCSPLTWDVYELYDEFIYALESNLYALKNEGEQTDYFALNLPVDADLKFLFFGNWPNTFEVDPADSATLVAEPVGTQAGLGALGFCYVPYHFVYNVRFPVMVQVSEEDEIFQFPLVVLIEGNLPREARTGETSSVEIPNLCDDESIIPTKVSVYGADSGDVEAKVSFECLSSKCNLGNTEEGFVEGNLPQCYNGNLIVEADGYKKKIVQYTSIEEGEVIVVLDKIYEKEIEIVTEEGVYGGDAVVSFISEEGISSSLIYPSQKKVTLGEGSYEIYVQLQQDSEITLPASTREECYDVPSSGIGGALGFTQTECIEVETTEQIISSALAGGGKDSYYFLDSELKNDDKITLTVNELEVPKSLDDLQNNYILFESYGVEVGFK